MQLMFVFVVEQLASSPPNRSMWGYRAANRLLIGSTRESANRVAHPLIMIIRTRPFLEHTSLASEIFDIYSVSKTFHRVCYYIITLTCVVLVPLSIRPVSTHTTEVVLGSMQLQCVVEIIQPELDFE